MPALEAWKELEAEGSPIMDDRWNQADDFVDLWYNGRSPQTRVTHGKTRNLEF